MTDPGDTGRGARPPGILGPFAVVAAAVAGGVLAEGWIMGLAAEFGPLWAFVAVTAVCSAGSCLVAFALDEAEARRGTVPLVRRIRRWVAEKRGKVEKRTAALAEVSVVLAFVLLSVSIGPLLTAVAVKLRGGDSRVDYALCIVASVVFSAVWVSIYSGGVAAVRWMFAA